MQNFDHNIGCREKWPFFRRKLAKILTKLWQFARYILRNFVTYSSGHPVIGQYNNLLWVLTPKNVYKQNVYFQFAKVDSRFLREEMVSKHLEFF
jgi:hypothetical protein